MTKLVSFGIKVEAEDIFSAIDIFKNKLKEEIGKLGISNFNRCNKNAFLVTLYDPNWPEWREVIKVYYKRE